MYSIRLLSLEGSIPEPEGNGNGRGEMETWYTPKPVSFDQTRTPPLVKGKIIATLLNLKIAVPWLNTET